MAQHATAAQISHLHSKLGSAPAGFTIPQVRQRRFIAGEFGCPAPEVIPLWHGGRQLKTAHARYWLQREDVRL